VSLLTFYKLLIFLAAHIKALDNIDFLVLSGYFDAELIQYAKDMHAISTWWCAH